MLGFSLLSLAPLADSAGEKHDAAAAGIPPALPPTSDCGASCRRSQLFPGYRGVNAAIERGTYDSAR